MAVDKAHRLYDLHKARKQKDKKFPYSHQRTALAKLSKWYKANRQPSGGILVLPTGAGKTYTAMRFLAENPLSDGYKVLWLVHKGDLVDQAFKEVEHHTGRISESRDKSMDQLNARMVSGSTTHDGVGDIKPSDDVIVATLQTMNNAKKKENPKFMKWLDSTDGKLFVIHDEAHHAPAPTFRKLLLWLRDELSDSRLLGLTATPTYTDERKRGWLSKVYPQGVVTPAEAEKLRAEGILSIPIYEESDTDYEVEIDEREATKLKTQFGDLPPRIIDKMSESKRRNQLIADKYANERDKYGKTIMFVDRWFQCEMLEAMLRKHGVRAGSIYSRSGGNARTAEERNLRNPKHNEEMLQKFRDGELDVLLNVRMLTEGTDVPDVQSVFLTRQTTSMIQMTQMIGRGLRGPKIGGTKDTYLVFFIDEWKEQIANLVKWDQLEGGLADDTTTPTEAAPNQWISIALLRRLAEEMDSEQGMASQPFLQYIPVGWYRVEYETTTDDPDELKTVAHNMVVVMSGAEEDWEKLLDEVPSELPACYSDPTLDYYDQLSYITEIRDRFFGEKSLNSDFGDTLLRAIFEVLRHIGQQEETPRFFLNESRNDHDIDKLIATVLGRDLGTDAKYSYLRNEFARTDRLWEVYFINFHRFYQRYTLQEARILDAKFNDQDPETHTPAFSNPETNRDREPSEEDKESVKAHDKYACLCCGYDSKRSLQVDHILPFSMGGDSGFNNLQTICRKCNGLKGEETINFRNNKTPLSEQPKQLPEGIKLPGTAVASEPEQWKRYLRKTINFFYRCAAVQDIKIGGRGKYFHSWRITLYPGNNPEWLADYLPETLAKIQKRRKQAGYGYPDSLIIAANGHGELVVTL
jgi:superfamily II DNA or RNA helicase